MLEWNICIKKLGKCKEVIAFVTRMGFGVRWGGVWALLERGEQWGWGIFTRMAREHC